MIRFDEIVEKVLTYNPKADIDLLRRAYVFSAKAHKGQTRLSGEPYLSHPLEVTSLLADMKLDETTLAAGLLHDVLEDTDVSPDQLREIFGNEITRIVESVTKMSQIKFTSPEVHQAENIRKVILGMVDDLRVIFIKLADRLHNLKTLKFLPEEKQKQIARETLEIYAPIANRLGMGRIKAELEDLSFRYLYQDEYFRLLSLVEERREKAEMELKKMKKELEKLLSENHIEAKILYRIKRLYSIFDKMRKRDIEFDQVFDFMALRIITRTVKDCYTILGLIHKKWTPIPGRFRDYIALPKPNLYQALHTTIITPEKNTFEIQIRTEEMDEIAENGIAAHWKYKDDKGLKDDERVKWLRELVEIYEGQKNPKEFLRNLKSDLGSEEIYVFTPKGEVIPLPMGSTPIDFAYKIHTEIGNHCIGAKINGKFSPLKTILKSGDIVEIITSPNGRPHRSWLNIVTTSKARSNIKHWLKLKEKERSINLGKKIWEKELEKYNLKTSSIQEKEILEFLRKFRKGRFTSINDFYLAIGYGNIIVDRNFIKELFNSIKKDYKEIISPRQEKSLRKETGIKIKDEGDISIRLAKCCSPVKGEKIIGYLTKGRGLTIHSIRCSYVKKEILDSERMIEVSWDSKFSSNYLARLNIKAEDKKGVLAEIASTIANTGSNIKKAQVDTFANEKAQIKLWLEIQNIDQLNSIINELKKIKEVNEVERV
ncbi:bifunctional (p)ppGpp synthetase/guanosine-3',5'-bis(diphosphate) 3'-pyrophosphohydrolase [Candidatus Aminicenantes bacterium AC-335-A11]|jgi:GTP pyrophosphokinase|nr:bifunctional (p)ppGpp synthetase/guanosine-3',5'-bis(diphosphate) 3'-pyrophosphohydrolase [SCandidatus Aminicenantes bacterium Aminicenantia_JdfR_composite]MCP2618567.1 bifunctional (p)ppGpp synthetase/guanosine-3',5'-bis(diphosphate) 3'-pyrophosphohydrolase [Candidatus Aminicenantes bacterium AC-335-A11]